MPLKITQQRKDSFLKLFILVLFVHYSFPVSAFSQPKGNHLIGPPQSLKGAQIITNPLFSQRFPQKAQHFLDIIGPTNSSYTIFIDPIDNKKKQSHLFPQQAFLIEVGEKALHIKGADLQGQLYGVSTVIKLLRSKQLHINRGYYFDWPIHHTRALHVVLRGISKKTLLRIIALAHEERFNTLILQIADGVKLKSMGELVRSDALTLKEIKEVIDYSRENGLEIIPEIKLLSHQEKLFKTHYPQFMFDNHTYDPRKVALYQVVYPILEEVIELFSPNAIHIGHDEISGWQDTDKMRFRLMGRELLPPHLFKDDVIRIYNFLEKRNIRTLMWGDMLIAPHETEDMDSLYFHARNGYSKIRRQLPRDIVICDWHYKEQGKNFNSSQLFSELGYSVLGATWTDTATTKNFSQFVAEMSGNQHGMIATTWFYVQQEKWEIIKNIISQSGRLFWAPERNKVRNANISH